MNCMDTEPGIECSCKPLGVQLGTSSADKSFPPIYVRFRQSGLETTAWMAFWAPIPLRFISIVIALQLGTGHWG